MAFDKIRYRVAGAAAVHDLLSRVVRVDDVSPGNVPKIFAFFQLLSWFTNLKKKQDRNDLVNRKRGRPLYNM